MLPNWDVLNSSFQLLVCLSILNVTRCIVSLSRILIICKDYSSKSPANALVKPIIIIVTTTKRYKHIIQYSKRFRPFQQEINSWSFLCIPTVNNNPNKLEFRIESIFVGTNYPGLNTCYFSVLLQSHLLYEEREMNWISILQASITSFLKKKLLIFIAIGK